MPESSGASTLSPVEGRVRAYLVERAMSAGEGSDPFIATVTYSQLCNDVDPDGHHWARPRYRGIGPVLGKVSIFEHRNGRPLLSALVVHAGDGAVGEGFTNMARELGFQIQPTQERAFWRNQVEALVSYWSGPGRSVRGDDPQALALALLAKVSGDIDEIRRILSAG